MKLSTRSRYGIQLMYDLAAHYGEGTQSVKSVSERQGISEAYLEQLIATLKKEGLVTSVRGAQGGYSLSREPEKITAGEVLRAMEDGLNFIDCLLEEDACGKACDCPSRFIWMRLRNGVNEILDGITLKDMLDEYACRKAQEASL